MWMLTWGINEEVILSLVDVAESVIDISRARHGVIQPYMKSTRFPGVPFLKAFRIAQVLDQTQ